MACQPRDPVAYFIERMEKRPPEERPKDWERTKQLMVRTAPAVGERAPDFTLNTLDGDRTITRSAFQDDRPLFLVFGSFT